MQVLSVENNPVLLLLQSTLQTATLATPAVPPSGDDVNISDAAKQLAQTRPSKQ